MVDVTGVGAAERPSDLWPALRRDNGPDGARASLCWACRRSRDTCLERVSAWSLAEACCRMATAGAREALTALLAELEGGLWPGNVVATAILKPLVVKAPLKRKWHVVPIDWRELPMMPGRFSVIICDSEPLLDL